MQSLKHKRQHKASKRYDYIFVALPFVSAASKEKSLHQPFIRHLIRVSREYLDPGIKREDTTGKDATSMLKDAILLSVVILLICAVNHAYGLFFFEEQGAGVTRGFFSQRRKIVGLK